ncbi:hypothetical protein [Paenibacillus aceris]|uniref:SMI1/KNR4 family protein n=1 Tax=Paenibacillus aceris TaxID=869555 RepID=A0ABS4HRK7_9BACL|nr:hypothetical protein [Paenibacillus aceris]MBP1961185.1 hypothetical protein [Paenibacillus aceris]NHW38023.1 hypothetical protein [Paenibacillus aceris]
MMIDSENIYEIREWSNLGHQVKFEFFEPNYDGDGEGFWFTDEMNWIIYCSHENSITFGGELLIRRIKENWSEWNEYLW